MAQLVACLVAFEGSSPCRACRAGGQGPPGPTLDPSSLQLEACCIFSLYLPPSLPLSHSLTSLLHLGSAVALGVLLVHCFSFENFPPPKKKTFNGHGEVGLSGRIGSVVALGWTRGRRDSTHGTWVSRHALSWRRARRCRCTAAGKLEHVRRAERRRRDGGAGGAAAAGARGARAGRLLGGRWRVAACVHAQARAYSRTSAREQARACMGERVLSNYKEK